MKQELLKLKSSCASRQMEVSIYGGRVLSFSINKQNALVDSGAQVGSTFWPSPQSLWDWPPPIALDSARYSTLEVSDRKICLQSGVDHSLGISVMKTFTSALNGFHMEYALVNSSNETVTVAPWEISRVSGGLSFYAANSPPEIQSSCEIKHVNDHYWYQYEPGKLQGIPKIYANNTAGWLANANEGLLLIKRFPQVEPKFIAPSEAEVEIYAHADVETPYVEVEQQGAFKAIKPGMESRWAVDWFLFELPSDVRVEAGSADLLSFVADVLRPDSCVAEVG
ncbi:protein of unknown function [Alteromonadaceae bacterium Bs31]|nr:protein of unknown function [Alteromonadaceae bacterium Bs31]